MGFVERRLRTSARIIAWQFADLAKLDITQDKAEYELLWIADRGVYGGAQAVAMLLIDAGMPWRVLGWALRVTPVRLVARGLYRLVANNRDRMPGGTPACALARDAAKPFQE
jgi:predicted DCC family thiol-disulfide oxidoreductase YuxK